MKATFVKVYYDDVEKVLQLVRGEEWVAVSAASGGVGFDGLHGW